MKKLEIIDKIVSNFHVVVCDAGCFLAFRSPLRFAREFDGGVCTSMGCPRQFQLTPPPVLPILHSLT